MMNGQLLFLKEYSMYFVFVNESLLKNKYWTLAWSCTDKLKFSVCTNVDTYLGRTCGFGVWQKLLQNCLKNLAYYLIITHF